MYCEYCGAKLENGAKFCTKCGQSVSGSAPKSRNASRPSQDTEGASHTSGIVAIVVALVLVVVILVLALVNH